MVNIAEIIAPREADCNNQYRLIPMLVNAMIFANLDELLLKRKI